MKVRSTSESPCNTSVMTRHHIRCDNDKYRIEIRLRTHKRHLWVKLTKAFCEYKLCENDRVVSSVVRARVSLNLQKCATNNNRHEIHLAPWKKSQSAPSHLLRCVCLIRIQWTAFSKWRLCPYDVALGNQQTETQLIAFKLVTNVPGESLHTLKYKNWHGVIMN